jgi:hypothetical protein
MAKNKKPIKVLTLDTETRGLFGQVFRVGLYDGNKYYKSNDFGDILEVLNQFETTENHIYVHNLDFDVAKISPVLFNNSSINFDKSMFINGRVASLQCDNFILHDSFMLLPSSLDKLCKDFEIGNDSKYDLTDYIIKQGYAIYDENGKYDKDKSLGNFFMNVPADDKVLNHYLKLDCVSLYKIIMTVCDISLVSIDDLVHCPTTPSLAMTVFKNQFKEDYNKSIKTKLVGDFGEFIEEFIRTGYCGGRTEVFTPYLKDGFHYDVNSLYPYVMKSFKYPVGKPELLHSMKAEMIYRFWKKTDIGAGFLHCKVYVPDMYIPPLPKHDYSGKLLFPVGNLEGVWSFPELYEAEKLGCIIIEISQAVYFDQTCYIFKNYIEHFEEIKTTSKGAKRRFAKDMSNTLYGKYGMIRTRNCFSDISKLPTIKKKFDDAVQEGLEKGLSPDEAMKKASQFSYHVHKHTKSLVNIQFIEILYKSRAEYIQPHIAAYVTSYARIELLRGLIRQHNKGVIGYCDTDSIACKCEMESQYVHNTEYGKFKLEEVIEEGLFLQPKFYAERNGYYTDEETGELKEKQTIRAKGVPKSVMKNFDFSSYENWLNIIKEGKQDFIEIYDNVLNRRKFLSALKNDDDFDKPVILRKCINLTLEQKRDIDYVNNVSKAHVRNDFGENADPDKKPMFEKYKKLLFEYDDNSDIIFEGVRSVGFIKHIKQGENFYEHYKKLSFKARRRYFRNKGIDIMNWCYETGWTIMELFSEMGELNDWD